MPTRFIIPFLLSLKRNSCNFFILVFSEKNALRNHGAALPNDGAALRNDGDALLSHGAALPSHGDVLRNDGAVLFCDNFAFLLSWDLG